MNNAQSAAMPLVENEQVNLLDSIVEESRIARYEEEHSRA